MIKKIALPLHLQFNRYILLPICQRGAHARVRRERNDRMQAVWHQQAKPAMPDEFLVIANHSAKHPISGSGLAQLIFAGWTAFDGDKEPASELYPLGYGMRKFLSHRKNHGGILERTDCEKKPRNQTLNRFTASIREPSLGLRAAGTGLPALPSHDRHSNHSRAITR
jgi:hypothetical protein